MQGSGFGLRQTAQFSVIKFVAEFWMLSVALTEETVVCESYVFVDTLLSMLVLRFTVTLLFW